MKQIELNNSRLRLQKEKVTDLIKPKMGKNGGATIIIDCTGATNIGCTHPTTTVLPTGNCL